MTSAPAPRRQTGQHQASSLQGFLPRALGLIAAAILTGLAFAAWQANGPALMNALSASGLAWCL